MTHHHHCSEEGCDAGHHHHHHHECCSDHHDHHCGCCHQEDHSFSDQLLALADEAWMELLKEKIKKNIEAKTGKHLDKLADIISKANHDRWNEKMSISKTKEDFKDKLSDFFHK